MYTARYKEMRPAYGFDDVAIAPGEITINPDQTEIDLTLGKQTFAIPLLAAALDAVVDPAFAVAFHRQGGLAVMNLEGVQTRYDHPQEAFEMIARASKEDATTVLQKAYAPPIRDNLVAQRVEEIKAQKAVCAVSVTPANTKRLALVAQEAGADLLFVQSTVTTARHTSKSQRGLILHELCQQLRMPVVVGNCVGYKVALELMEEGITGLLVGVGPGAICTSREVLGIGVPQVTATMDCAAARDDYYRATGRYVPVITDGGMRTGGDICKAFASGADGVMLGTTFAQAAEAPGRGFSWGMSTPHASLPRGTRLAVGTRGPLERILLGPTSVTDGTENLVNALRTSMGMVGARTIREMHSAELIVAPSIKTEGKLYQFAQGLARG